MAVEPSRQSPGLLQTKRQAAPIGYGDIFSDSSSESGESDDESTKSMIDIPRNGNRRLVFACDDGCVRLYHTSDSDGLTYARTFPRVKGKILYFYWLN